MGRHGENIRKRRDGRWEARYAVCDENSGKRVSRSVYGRSYEEAKAKRSAVTGRDTLLSESGVLPQIGELPPDLAFETAAQEWLDSVSLTQKPSTHEKYGFIYHSYLEAAFGGVMLFQITEKFARERLASCEEVSESLLKSIYSVLNGILRYASGQYHAALPEIKKPPAAGRRREVETFTRAEQTRLLSVLCTNMDCFKLGVFLCLFTGLRLGELCALKWDDIDRDGRTLFVKRTVQRTYVERGGSKTALLETSPKSSRSKREIPLPDVIIALLMDYRNGKEYIFGGSGPLDPRNMQNHYKRIVREAGIPYKNFHTLRHTYATNCIEGGTDVKSLSEMLGHSNVKITLNCYVHPSMDTKRRYADDLCKYYGGLKGQIGRKNAAVSCA